MAVSGNNDPNWQVPAGQPPATPNATSGGKGGAQPNMFQSAAGATNMGMAGAAREMGYQFNPYQAAQVGDTRNFMSGGGGAAQAEMIDPKSAQWSAAQTAQEDIDRFMNPYIGSVVDTSLADIERARMAQQNAAAAQATAAGAFGGSRGALMEAEVGRNALDQAARTASQLRSQGFTQAANLAQQDVTRRQQAAQMNAAQQMQALLANQASGLAASQTNAQLGAQAGIANAGNALKAALANMSAQNQAAQFNALQDLAASGQRLTAGQQLANIGQQGFNQAQDVLAGQQAAGNQMQALNQAIMSGAQGQYGGFQQAPQLSLGYLASALGAGTMPTTTTGSKTPGLFDYLTLGATAFSDRRLKTNIHKIGETLKGINVYQWQWSPKAIDLGIGGPTIGVMAQEVAEIIPEAVTQHENGYLQVNYRMLA